MFASPRNWHRRLAGLPWAWIEQGTSSGGSFLAFYLSAMLLGPDQYGVLAATWVCIQFFLGLSSSWVSTALSSLRVEASQEVHLLGVCLARHLHVLLVLLVALPWMLAVVVPETFSDVPLLVTVLSLGVSTLVGEFLRRYLARRQRRWLASIYSGLKWLVSASLILLAYATETLSFGSVIWALCLANAVALLLVALLLLRVKESAATADDRELSRRVSTLSFPVLVDNLTVATSSVLLAVVIRSQIDNAAYGGYQAVTSLCGAVTVFLQLIDIHYSSHLLYTQVDLRRTQRDQNLLLVAMLALVSLVIYPARSWLLVHVLGPSYSSFTLLLPLLALQSMIQVLSQFAIVQLRVLDGTKVYYWRAGIRACGTITALFIAMQFGVVEAIAAVLVLSVLIQYLAVRVLLSMAMGKHAHGVPDEALPLPGFRTRAA